MDGAAGLGKAAGAVQTRAVPLHDGLLPPGASSAERAALAERARARARQQLEIHAGRSCPAPPAAEEGARQLPHTTRQRKLMCKRRAELHALCCELLVADKAYMQKVPGAAGHALQTWVAAVSCVWHLVQRPVQASPAGSVCRVTPLPCM